MAKFKFKKYVQNDCSLFIRDSMGNARSILHSMENRILWIRLVLFNYCSIEFSRSNDHYL